MTGLAEHAERLRADRTPFVQATVVRIERPASARTGDRALVLPDGTLEGFVGGTCATATVRTQALRLLETGEPALLRISPTPDLSDVPGLVSVTNPCLSGGTLDIFLEPVLPPMLIQVYGEGPIARALLRIGTAAGYAMRPADGPATPLAPDTAAVVVATHGRSEEPLLTAALAAGIPYIGLIASPRRGTAVTAGLPGGDRIKTPAGLDLGARTPEEIALSILAEILTHRPHPAGSLTASTDPAVVIGDTAYVEDVTPDEGTAATDPVCGMGVDDPAAFTLRYAGRTWYFCGPGCRDAFADDPDRYTLNK